MDLREYLTVLRKQWYLVAALAIAGAAFGVYRAESAPPVYRATSKVFVSLTGGSTAQELVQGSDYTQNLVQSYAALTTMPVVLDPVIDQLGLDTTARKLSQSVTADAPLDTVIIEISAKGSAPDTVADVSNAVASQLSTTITDLSPKANGQDNVNVEVVARAQPPDSPIAPRKRLIVLTALLAGLVAGVMLSVLRHLLDTRVRSAEDVQGLTDAALLGSIPRLRRVKGMAVSAIAPLSVASEAYRRVQTNLQFLGASERLRSIVVTSSVDGEGKSVTSVNLAIALAEKGKRVLLVDADMRRPSLGTYCHLEESAGLTTVLIGMADLESVTQSWGQPTLDVLTVGELPPNPSQLVDSASMRLLLERATAAYDIVVLDAPPLLPVADAAVLGRITDGALVVAGCHKLRDHQLTAALASLEAVDARCLGIVANQVSARGREAKYYGQPQRRFARWGVRGRAAREHAPARTTRRRSRRRPPSGPAEPQATPRPVPSLTASDTAAR